MPIDLFAGIPVTDYAAALAWYERIFGSTPSFVPTDTEAVWELAPAERETHSNGVRKAAYRDPDGNEFGFGGAPVS
jgi:catechol 2,3-dioxygenase-like lactoylglutathione lyase family enzyme